MERAVDSAVPTVSMGLFVQERRERGPFRVDEELRTARRFGRRVIRPLLGKIAGRSSVARLVGNGATLA